MQKAKNYAGQLTPEDIDSEYQNCNFSQAGSRRGVDGWQSARIFPDDDTPRTFIECNLQNALPPPASTLIRCNTSIVEHATDERITHGRINPETLSREMRQNKHRKDRRRVRSRFIECRAAKVAEVREFMRTIDANPK